jgi:hypothetical protein
MKKINKVFVSLGALACVIASVLVMLSLYQRDIFTTTNNTANVLTAGQSVLQRYQNVNVESLDDRARKDAADEIYQTVRELAASINTLRQQESELISQQRPVVEQIRTEIKAIEAAAVVIAREAEPKQASLKKLLDIVSEAERKYIQQNRTCTGLPNLTAKQKQVKKSCETQAANLKKVLDTSVTQLANERNKLPGLESQKVIADKAAADKTAACARLAARTPARNKCTIDAGLLKKRADALAVEIEKERQYAQVETRVMQKQSEKNALIQRLMALEGQQATIRNGIYGAQTMIDSLTALQERFMPQVVEKPPKGGCMDSSSGNVTNYDPDATWNDGTCNYTNDSYTQPALIGVCTEPGALNARPAASLDTSIGEYSDSEVCKWPPIIPVIEDNPGNVCTCPSGAELGNINEQVYRMNAFITDFGGSGDNVVFDDERGSVSGELLRGLDSSGDSYIAWPLPEAEKANGFLDTAECYGPKTESWKGERNARANEALDKQYAEVSYTNPSGVKRTVTARIVDRGPADGGRIDASKAVWSGLGLSDVLELGPSTKHGGHTVPLEIRLLPKTPGPDGCMQ